jgi:hypothetical protein
MGRIIQRVVPVVAAVLALLLPLAFLTETVIAELGGNVELILRVKRWIA